ncbi:Ca [Operophtera brumata]|uniref:Ca n=1 Tax=Operophtera brumata TaxID=104452 RepID=A0A0L7LPY3_OPEBR|nr:Ca [Operophtera brumata]
MTKHLFKLDTGADLNEKIEYVFLVIFTGECVMKIIAYGFVMHAGSYLRNGWNLLDFTIVVIGFTDSSKLHPQSHDTSAAHRTSGEIMEVPHPCDDETGYNCSKLGDDMICREGWDGPNFGITNFDNFGLSMLTVFQCITLEGWTDVMYHSSPKKEKKPRTGGTSRSFVKSSSQANNEHDSTDHLGIEVPEQQKGYYVSLFNRFDCFVVIGSISEMVLTKSQVMPPLGISVLRCVRLLRVFKVTNQVICSNSEMVLTKSQVMPPLGISVLRCVRLLRVFKVTKYWRSLSNLVASLLNSIQSIASLLLLLFLFIMIFALLGMQVFGGKFNYDPVEEKDRHNFDCFWQALLTVFQYHHHTFWLPTCEVIHCNRQRKLQEHILLNVFLAIAVDNLADAESLTNIEKEEGAPDDKEVGSAVAIEGGQVDTDDEYIHDDDPYQSDMSRSERDYEETTSEDPHDQEGDVESILEGIDEERERIEEEQRMEEEEEEESHQRNHIVYRVLVRIDKLTEKTVNTEYEDEPRLKRKPTTSSARPRRLSEVDIHDTKKPIPEATSFFIFSKDNRPRRVSELNMPNQTPPIPNASSFFVFSPTNRFRVLCYKLSASSTFGNIILVCIMFSSAMLACEDPLDAAQKGFRNWLLSQFDVFFTGIFTLELFLKLITYGLGTPRGRIPSFCFQRARHARRLRLAHLYELKHVVQCVIVAIKTIGNILLVTSLLQFMFAVMGVQMFKYVVKCVIVAIKTIGNIMLVTYLLQFMFAVVGVQLFKGKFFRCNDISKMTKMECQGTYLVFEKGKYIVKDRDWGRNDFHFDNVMKGMLTLFTVSTFEGWPGLLYVSIDSNAEDRGPITNFRPIVAAYYIIYIIIIAFFMVNIFVGFVIVTFQNEGEQEYKNCELDKNQRNCIEFALKAKPIRRYIPKHRIQYKVWWFVTSQPFEYAIFVLIMINTITLAMKYHNQSPEYSKALDLLNMLFTAVFALEFIFKLAAFRFKNYFGDAWNTFDFIIVLGSIIDIVVSQVNELKNQGSGGLRSHVVKEHSLPSINFFRLFRVMRLVKLLSRGEGIRTLLWTFIKSFQALPYVALLILMLFFIYAVVGMQVKRGKTS